MGDGVGAFPTRVVVRKLIFTAVGVFLFAVGLTVLFQGMRSVMDIGGSCASGGPYEIRQECPDNAWMIPVSIFVGLGGTAFVVAGTFRGGPKLVALAWPALFLALGWNFLEYAFDPPPPDTGIVWGWLICGVVFVAMGGIPLVLVLLNAKPALWGADSSVDRTGTVAATAAALSRLAAKRSRQPRPFVPDDATDDATDGDLVDDLERLAALHRSGQLTDGEYARAKQARLSEDPT